jgi:hypothetical protein
MGEQCSWKGDMIAVVVVVMTMMMIMMKFIEENQNIKCLATFLELWSEGNRSV